MMGLSADPAWSIQTAGSLSFLPDPSLTPVQRDLPGPKVGLATIGSLRRFIDRLASIASFCVVNPDRRLVELLPDPSLTPVQRDLPDPKVGLATRE
jgi:hypothetical protein